MINEHLTRESVDQILSSAFEVEVARHSSRGRRAPTADECIELANGEILRLDSDDVGCALYYVLHYFLSVSNLDDDNVPLSELIGFLDVRFDGAKLEFIRTALDDEYLPISVLEDEKVLEQAKAAWPEAAFDYDSPSNLMLVAAKTRSVSMVTAQQASAICDWLRLAVGWSEIRLGDYVNIVEGALWYWGNRANQRDNELDR